MQTKKIMENPIDNYILGGEEIPTSTGFEDYGDTFILDESKPIVIEGNVYVSDDITPSDTTPFYIAPTETATETVTETATATEDSDTKLNNPTQNFMTNANPFFIGIGIVVGLVLLGDFFKSKSE